MPWCCAAASRSSSIFVRDTLNIDENLIEAAITPRTRAIFPVHYAGVPAEMDAINAIAARHGLVVVEDAAQALGSFYKGRAAGSLGHMAAFSFHETKNLISGEGGALTINDVSFVERAEIVREKGTNRKLFFRGHVDKYTWVDLGSSFLPGELVASFLFGQFEMSAEIKADRLATWRAYDDALQPFRDRGLRTPVVPNTCSHNGHLYYVLLPSLQQRTELIARMKADDIGTPFHYVPLHSSPAGRKFGRTPGPMPNTDDDQRHIGAPAAVSEDRRRQMARHRPTEVSSRRDLVKATDDIGVMSLQSVRAAWIAERNGRTCLSLRTSRNGEMKAFGNVVAVLLAAVVCTAPFLLHGSCRTRRPICTSTTDGRGAQPASCSGSMDSIAGSRSSCRASSRGRRGCSR